jgi:hypothetical protein
MHFFTPSPTRHLHLAAGVQLRFSWRAAMLPETHKNPLKGEEFHQFFGFNALNSFGAE